MSHLYFVTFALCLICILSYLHLVRFAFCFICILSYLHFVIFAICRFCILSDLHFVVFLHFVCLHFVKFAFCLDTSFVISMQRISCPVQRLGMYVNSTIVQSVMRADVDGYWQKDFIVEWKNGKLTDIVCLNICLNIRLYLNFCFNEKLQAW